MNLLKQLKNAVSADSFGRNKAGNVVVRLGFFYRHGMSAQSFAAHVKKAIVAANIAATVVAEGEHNAPFNGGASVARGSHFWAEIQPVLS